MNGTAKLTGAAFLSFGKSIDEVVRRWQEDWAARSAPHRVEEILAALQSVFALTVDSQSGDAALRDANLLPLAMQIDIWCERLPTHQARAKSRAAAIVFLSST